MAEQRRFPPKGWATRRVFNGVIVALAMVMLLATVFGPVLTTTDPDPRPFVAVLSMVTYLAMFAVIFWIVWLALRPGRAQRHDDTSR